MLDIGSNTVHMLIVDAVPGARPTPQAQKKEVVRLMRYIGDDGRISDEGVQLILTAVDECMELAESSEVSQLVPMATSAIREAVNGKSILHKVEARLGQGVRVLSGEDEASLTFLAVRRWFGWDAGKLLVIDIGGGSLEVAIGDNEEPDQAMSVPAGAGRVTRAWLPEGVGSPDDIDCLREKVRGLIKPMAQEFKGCRPDHVVGTSKTIRSLARLTGAMTKATGGFQSWVMRREQLEDWIPRLAMISPDQRVALPGITAERTEQIVGGAVVVDEIMSALKLDRIETCPWALREGAILRWLDQFGRTRMGF